MISLEDCIGLCGLDDEQVAAIGEHEHIPEMAAAALASYLLKQPHGSETIRTMIIDDIRKLDDGRITHAAELFMAFATSSNKIPTHAPDWPSSRLLISPGSLARTYSRRKDMRDCDGKQGYVRQKKHYLTTKALVSPRSFWNNKP